MENVTLSVNEQNLIDNSKFKRGSRVTKVNNLEAKHQGHNAKSFESGISLGREIKQGSDWLKTVEAKDLMKSKEVKWTNPEFGKRVYGYAKTQYCQYINVGKVTDEEIAAYKADAGERDLSITALLAFLKPKKEKKDKKDNSSINYERDAEGKIDITKVNLDDIDDVIAALMEMKLQAE
jgi:hypothetical protein